MHVLFRDSQGLEEAAVPTDLGQSPADLVVLSFSDSDLGAFAQAWHQGGGVEGRFPSLRLANVGALQHPLSVDTYIEQTLSQAKGILIRLIGGVAYWAYGIQELAALAIERSIALAVIPGDRRDDAKLDAASTVPTATLKRLRHYCETGGPVAAQAALAQLALAAGLYAGPVKGSKGVPNVGFWTPEHGLSCRLGVLEPESERPLAIVTFYRAFLTAYDLAPLEALAKRLRARGFRVLGLFAPSLKAADAAPWIERQIAHLQPAAIVNATAFSGRGDDGRSPLDSAGVPIFQVALATSTRAAWAESERGLSPTDLAMHVVLPELDGRIFAGVASFKEASARDPWLEFSRYAHNPHAGRLDAATDLILGWHQLGQTPRAERRLALVMSTYPGKSWNMAHAVGLDAPASTNAILADLAGAGYRTHRIDDLPGAIGKARLFWPLEDYRNALAGLPETLRTALDECWGPLEADPSVQDGSFVFSALELGNIIVALQPERTTFATRDVDYHDTSRVPRHAYVAFYLWLAQRAQALVHVGAHGTLEWLPGKSAALSEACWPAALTRGLPVLYPFIVNDPGEAAQAKRRIAAVTLGHVPPPLRTSGTPHQLTHLEALLDEFSNADGLDPARRDRLQDDIRQEAQARGVAQDLGLSEASCPFEAITKIDRFVCDIKESQYGDGLHIWGRSADPAMKHASHHERTNLLAALDGKRIEPGPSGSPYRGRTDVLPTGRNLYTTDPRGVPTRAAYAQGVRLAEEFLRRHLQEVGDWPQNLIVDLWGSATMRTAGEEFAMALHCLGIAPVWDENSERVSGLEILELEELERPRLDVTLRISGLFRDVFPPLCILFTQAVDKLAKLDEPPEWNPYRGKDVGNRVFGPEPGRFGLEMSRWLGDYSDAGRLAAGRAWLAASSFAFDGQNSVEDKAGIAARVQATDAFIHAQDLPETDILLAEDYATHEAGFAAAQSAVGGRAKIYHLDNRNPEKPSARLLNEEIARVVYARAAHPGWIAGMRRHGFRGAAEIAATLEHMAQFAQLADAVPPHLFDLFWQATLDDPQTLAFLEEANSEALAAMRQRFVQLAASGLWHTRLNSAAAQLDIAI